MQEQMQKSSNEAQNTARKCSRNFHISYKMTEFALIKGVALNLDRAVEFFFIFFFFI